MPKCWGAMCSEPGRGGGLSPEKSEAALDLVLVDDRRGVAVADSVLVGEPVDPLFTAEKGRPRFHMPEPLSELTTCDEGDTCDEALVHVGRVRQGHWHLQGKPLSDETASVERCWQDPVRNLPVMSCLAHRD